MTKYISIRRVPSDGKGVFAIVPKYSLKVLKDLARLYDFVIEESIIPKGEMPSLCMKIKKGGGFEFVDFSQFNNNEEKYYKEECTPFKGVIFKKLNFPSLANSNSWSRGSKALSKNSNLYKSFGFPLVEEYLDSYKVNHRTIETISKSYTEEVEVEVVVNGDVDNSYKVIAPTRRRESDPFIASQGGGTISQNLTALDMVSKTTFHELVLDYEDGYSDSTTPTKGVHDVIVDTKLTDDGKTVAMVSIEFNELQNLRKELDKYRTLYTSAYEKNKEITKEYENYQGYLSISQETIEELRKELTSKDEELDSLQRKLKSDKSNHEAKEKELTSLLEKNESTISGLKSNVTGLEAKVTRLQATKLPTPYTKEEFKQVKNYLVNSLSKYSSVSNVPDEEKELARVMPFLVQLFSLTGLKDSKGYKALATFGDSVVKTDVVRHVNSIQSVHKFISNANMQFALVRFGIDSFWFIPEHFAGSIFEACYGLAELNNRQDVKNFLLVLLIGDYYRNDFVLQDGTVC